MMAKKLVFSYSTIIKYGSVADNTCATFTRIRVSTMYLRGIFLTIVTKYSL